LRTPVRSVVLETGHLQRLLREANERRRSRSARREKDLKKEGSSGMDWKNSSAQDTNQKKRLIVLSDNTETKKVVMR